jgi:hypothetical protein
LADCSSHSVAAACRRLRSRIWPPVWHKLHTHILAISRI